MRMARALALYVVGRLARPTTRTGFFWTTPTSSVDGGSCQLLKEFVKVTGMRESELNLGDFGVPGRKPLIALRLKVARGGEGSRRAEARRYQTRGAEGATRGGGGRAGG